MQIIQDGGEIKLHSMEWVNKSSGRGDMELIVDDGKSIRKYSYPYWFPFTPYTEVFPRLFPWANFEADKDFFVERDMFFCVNITAIMIKKMMNGWLWEIHLKNSEKN